MFNLSCTSSLTFGMLSLSCTTSLSFEEGSVDPKQLNDFLRIYPVQGHAWPFGDILLLCTNWCIDFWEYSAYYVQVYWLLGCSIFPVQAHLLSEVLKLSRHDAASDEFLHNFIRSSIDPLDSTVNVGFTDWIFPHVTPAAMHLDTAVCNTALEVRKTKTTMGFHIQLIFPWTKWPPFRRRCNCILMNEKFCIMIWVSRKFVPKCTIVRKSALVQVMAWRQTGNKPLPEPTLTQFTDTYMRH